MELVMRGFMVFFYLFGVQSASAQSFQTGDSIYYLTAKDTIFLTVGVYSDKIFEHCIAEKQTLFSLAKFYGLTLNDIYFHNPELRDKVITIGEPVKIPIPNRAIIRYKSQAFKAGEYIPVCYKVKPGDNLFRISKIFFKMPIDTVMARNGIHSYAIQPGQVIQIGWMSIDGIPESYQRSRQSPSRIRNVMMQKEYLEYMEKNKKKEYEEQGVAFWQKNSNQKSELYALHRRAPLHSLIEIENPMKKQIIYAKVIGRIPETAYGREVIIVLSQEAALQLGAKDERFFVKLKYLR